MEKACGIKEQPSDIWHPLLFSSLNQHKHTHRVRGRGMQQYGTCGIKHIGLPCTLYMCSVMTKCTARRKCSHVEMHLNLWLQ